jgi:dTDP-4-dehydrorhamnose reductase
MAWSYQAVLVQTSYLQSTSNNQRRRPTTSQAVEAEKALRRDLRFVHISTDCVFWGDVGGYRQDHPLGPVGNYR